LNFGLSQDFSVQLKVSPSERLSKRLSNVKVTQSLHWQQIFHNFTWYACRCW